LLKVAIPSQGGHLAGAGYQAAGTVRSHRRWRRTGRARWGGAAGRVGRPAWVAGRAGSLGGPRAAGPGSAPGRQGARRPGGHARRW